MKDVIDDLIEDVQGARLLEDVLPLDRFAQAEIVDNRVVVTINKRVMDMPGVKNVTGVALVSKCHESIHIARDFRRAGVDGGAHRGGCRRSSLSRGRSYAELPV